MNDYYILDGHNVVKVDSVEEWAGMFEATENRRVASTDMIGARVSTVFLGLDHNYRNDGPPLLFETMVFPSYCYLDALCERCSTWRKPKRSMFVLLRGRGEDYLARNKFHAKREIVDGITFHSRKEAKRYRELKLLEKAGVIRGLELQPKFPIILNGIKCFTYIADFVYFEGEKRIVEDCKGVLTPIYRLKKKVVQAIYGFTILET